MKYISDYYNVLEEDLKDDLDWLKKEFEILFNSKRNRFTKQDKSLADRIIKNMLIKRNIYDKEGLLYLLIYALQNLEKMYPSLMHSN